jgi:hypoxanthine phosphoribosyltransferase
MSDPRADDAVGAPVFSPPEIAAAIDRLAEQIARDYARQPLVLLGVLKGALYAVVDLARALSRRPGGPSGIFVEYVCVSSYGRSTESSGEVRILRDASVPLTGRHVLIVEDLADNGYTLAEVRRRVAQSRPASLAACVLFDKPARRRVDIPLEYVGLPAPDTFVVGYGLDYQERYRNLPYLAELRPGLISKEG